LLSQKSRRTNVSDYYNGSVLSGATDQTFLTQGTTQAYIEHCGSSIASSNQSNDGGSSQMSLLNGSEGSNSTIVCFDDDRYFGEVPGVLEFSGIRVIFQGKLGSVSNFKSLLTKQHIVTMTCIFSLQGNFGRGNY
jgi:hypothetical protein